MSNILDTFELDGLREDFNGLLGIFDFGGDEESIERASTLVTISRVIDRGTIDPTTLKYSNPVKEQIYAGPAHFSPVTFRRDRQELGGGEAVRIRQYRSVLPWDSGDIRIDDVLTVNFCADPEVVGRSFDVTDVMYESEIAARRITLTDTSDNSDLNNC